MKATKITKSICILLVLSILISGCASTTLFQTSPSFASVYVNGQNVGTTPYKYSDRKAAGASTSIAFKKDGYKDLYINLKRNEQLDMGALISGIFFIYPLIWLKKYNPVHYYDLENLGDGKHVISVSDTAHYLKGEDEQIKITIDSVIRANSLPESLKRDHKTHTETLNTDFTLPSLSEGNDYVFIYYTVVEKRDLNISLMDSKLDNSYVKDDFGKLYGVVLARGPYIIKYVGGSVFWNPKLFQGTELEKEFLLFEVPKKTMPIQMKFLYRYMEESTRAKQIKIGQIDIDLVQHD
ncbi:MAG: PEGA domain-containing protein [Bacteroidales bacterium]|nr:PEGA domain-containing protein [Bacteroidales bacterium]MDP3002052.1 PEGA domain-containing protein [Bacteroidales bacterium]